MPQLLAGLTTTLTFALWCFAFTIAIQTSQPVLEETPVLELATMILVGIGLVGIGAVIRKRRRVISSEE
jgi:hypothetical protein